jgi:hypothetical protein
VTHDVVTESVISSSASDSVLESNVRTSKESIEMIRDEVFDFEVEMSEEDLELLVTLDDPGEDDLEEDTFHNQAENPSNVSNKEATRPAN